jgi:hypothetical protein
VSKTLLCVRLKAEAFVRCLQHEIATEVDLNRPPSTDDSDTYDTATSDCLGHLRQQRLRIARDDLSATAFDPIESAKVKRIILDEVSGLENACSHLAKAVRFIRDNNKPTKQLPDDTLRALQQSLRDAVESHAGAEVRPSLRKLAELDRRIWINPPLQSAEDMTSLLDSPIASLAAQLEMVDVAFQTLKLLKPGAGLQTEREAAFATVAQCSHRIEYLFDHAVATTLEHVAKESRSWATEFRKTLYQICDYVTPRVDYEMRLQWDHEGDSLAKTLQTLKHELLAAMKQLHAESRNSRSAAEGKIDSRPPNPAQNAVGADERPTRAAGMQQSETHRSREVRAILLIEEEPELTIAQIAITLNVNRRSPYKWKAFMRAFRAQQGI